MILNDDILKLAQNNNVLIGFDIFPFMCSLTFIFFFIKKLIQDIFGVKFLLFCFQKIKLSAAELLFFLKDDLLSLFG